MARRGPPGSRGAARSALPTDHDRERAPVGDRLDDCGFPHRVGREGLDVDGGDQAPAFARVGDEIVEHVGRRKGVPGVAVGEVRVEPARHVVQVDVRIDHAEPLTGTVSQGGTPPRPPPPPAAGRPRSPCCGAIHACQRRRIRLAPAPRRRPVMLVIGEEGEPVPEDRAVRIPSRRMKFHQLCDILSRFRL